MSKAFDDARAGLESARLSATVCIIGAGAAGITLARRLVGRVPSVLLVEAGGMELDGDTQWLYDGRNIGLEYHDLVSCRLRFFGGTTNHWAGYCRPNDPIDYLGRPELEVPPWPVGLAELQPFIAEAGVEIGLDPNFFDPARYIRRAGFDPALLLDEYDRGLMTKVFQISDKVRFREIYADGLASQENLRVVLHLNATHVQLAPDGRRVAHIDARTLNGRSYRLDADYFVLACHAIENARLLLHADDVQPRGIGNAHDHVGRYFMEHPAIFASRLYPSTRFPRFYNRPLLERQSLNANLSFDDATTAKLGILQYYCRFDPVYAEPPVQNALRGLADGFMKPLDRDFVEDALMALRHFNQLVEAAQMVTGVDDRPMYFMLDQRIEQAPNRHSRIVLSDERDAIGLRRADLHWHLDERDYRTFQIGQEKVVQELSALGMGRFAVEELTPELIERRLVGHYHHIGTTRMSVRREDGVVDPDGRVHGVDNLYVAGSSVFPSAGYSAPTMVVMAMAMRLGETLAGRAVASRSR